MNSKLTSLKKPFWAHQGDESFKSMTLIKDLPHPCSFVPYIHLQRYATKSKPFYFKVYLRYILMLHV